MAGRTPAEAVNTFIGPLGRAVSCLTNAVVNVGGGYHPAPEPHMLALNDGVAIRVGTARQELISYQWHPTGRSPITFPHFHLGPGSRIGDERVARAHLPSGRIAPQAFLRLLIAEFGVPPRRADWDAVLTETQAVFVESG